jgi:hypothetical protein
MALLLAACSDEPAGPGEQPPAGGEPTATIRVHEPEPAHSILLEAEAGKVAAPMAVFEDAEASGGSYVLAPEGPEGEEINVGGEVVHVFHAPEAGAYALWLRTRFSGACGDSLSVALDGLPVGTVQDSVYGAWHWTPLSGRKLDLAPGEHVLVVGNREDGSAYDQVLLTADPDERPAGIATLDVPGRTAGAPPAPQTRPETAATTP